jgi:FkbM family methyltransferase
MSLRLVHEVHLAAAAAHYDLRNKQSRIQSARDLAGFFFRLVRALKPDLFVEVGAKDARTSVRARRYLPDARVVAFEPNPHNFRRFDGEERLGGIEFLPYAIADRNGPITFNVITGLNGEAMPVTTGQGSIHRRSDPTAVLEPVTVQAVTLDSFFADDAYGSAALWIDVEGAQREVLVGAERVLAKTTCIIIELEDRPLWQGHWMRPQVLDFLAAAGFFPIARDFQSRYQFNYVFVREHLADSAEVRTELAYFHSAISGHGAKVRDPAAVK